MKRQALHWIVCVLIGGALVLWPHSAAWAGPKAGAFELGAFARFFSFDDDLGADNDLGFGGRFGYFFTRNHQIEFDLSFASPDDDLGGDLDVDITNWAIAYTYNFDGTDSVVPYVSGGLGSSSTEISDIPVIGDIDDDDRLIMLGGGVRFHISDLLGLRVNGSYVNVDTDFDADTHFVVDAGLSWFVGGN